MKGISSMATRSLLADLTVAAASSGFRAVEFESAGGVEAARRVAAGEQVDLVVLASGALRGLVADGHVVSGSVVPLALSQTAVAVRAAESAPSAITVGAAFDDAAGVRAALRASERIGYSTGPSGTALLRQIETWGMADELRDRLVQARPGMPVARLLAEGEVDIGFQQLSEMVGQSGARVLGVLPADCAIDTIFAGGVAMASTDKTAASDVLSFFASSSAARIVRAHSFHALPQG